MQPLSGNQRPDLLTSLMKTTQHLNFQKCSERGVLCTFWLGNVLRAATACTFSTSQLPKVLRRWCALCILTWKCASRHNSVQLFASLRTRRFSEPTFRPSGATNHWKNTVFRDFPTFSRACISLFLFSDLLSSALLLSDFPPLLFHLSILLEVWLLNFLRLLQSRVLQASSPPPNHLYCKQSATIICNQPLFRGTLWIQPTQDHMTMTMTMTIITITMTMTTTTITIMIISASSPSSSSPSSSSARAPPPPPPLWSSLPP